MCPYFCLILWDPSNKSSSILPMLAQVELLSFATKRIPTNTFLKQLLHSSEIPIPHLDRPVLLPLVIGAVQENQDEENRELHIIKKAFSIRWLLRKAQSERAGNVDIWGREFLYRESQRAKAWQEEQLGEQDEVAFWKGFTFDFEMRSHWRVLSVKRWHRAFCGEETEDDQGRRKEITYETIH